MRSIIEQNRIQDQILRERLTEVLPAVMRETGTECWIIASREYNEDPMFHHIVPSGYPTARRITILMFAMEDNELKRISISMPDAELEKYYVRDYDRKTETQFEALERVIRRIGPARININVSDSYAYTDGLSAGLLRKMKEELPADITERFTGSDEAGIRLMETRTRTELEYYPEVMRIAEDIIDEAFSDRVIVPGVTTCRDVMDYMTVRVNELGITTWFPPTIDLQNEKGMQGEDTVIRRGDLVHCDFGITCMNMRTDTQRLCYVLKENETDAPAELKEALKRNNRFQDIVCENMIEGRTGNAIFLSSIEQGKKEGLRPVLYTHPLGLFGHACGPTIGLWTNQNPVYPAGELVLHDLTSFALELSIIEYLEMYKRDTYIFTEESVVFHGGKVYFLSDNRHRLYTVGG
ncbi:MAG: M24 family metallopeptidase [Solobacterium sp.]|nr:M24 family metallopeptidase [Solobacterium sp.]